MRIRFLHGPLLNRSCLSRLARARPMATVNASGGWRYSKVSVLSEATTPAGRARAHPGPAPSPDTRRSPWMPRPPADHAEVVEDARVAVGMQRAEVAQQELAYQLLHLRRHVHLLRAAVAGEAQHAIQREFGGRRADEARGGFLVDPKRVRHRLREQVRAELDAADELEALLLLTYMCVGFCALTSIIVSDASRQSSGRSGAAPRPGADASSSAAAGTSPACSSASARLSTTSRGTAMTSDWPSPSLPPLPARSSSRKRSRRDTAGGASP